MAGFFSLFISEIWIYLVVVLPPAPPMYIFPEGHECKSEVIAISAVSTTSSCPVPYLVPKPPKPQPIIHPNIVKPYKPQNVPNHPIVSPVKIDPIMPANPIPSTSLCKPHFNPISRPKIEPKIESKQKMDPKVEPKTRPNGDHSGPHCQH